eukprot:12536724-Alexandrium_andersonii.AAC.1
MPPKTVLVAELQLRENAGPRPSASKAHPGHSHNHMQHLVHPCHHIACAPLPRCNRRARPQTRWCSPSTRPS